MATLVEKQEYICVDVKDNHNKYWLYELYDSGDVVTRWGRCGYGSSSQEKRFSKVGRSFVEQKINEKERKGYRKLDVMTNVGGDLPKIISHASLTNIAKKQIRFSSPIVEQLVEYLVKTNAHNIHNASGGKITYNESTGIFQTPRGMVTQDNISKARALLTKIGSFVQKTDFRNTAFVHTLEDYLSLVPVNVGMGRFTPETVFPNQSAVQRQNAVLDSLESSFNTITQSQLDVTPKKDEPKLFDVKLELVTDSKVIDRITKFYYDTLNRRHVSSTLKPKNIYSVSIKSVDDDFDNIGKSIGNMHCLFHGTKCSNLLSILKHGLIIPPSSCSFVTGRLYGDGIYAAPSSTKALNYATSFWGGIDEKRYFVLVVLMAMGKEFVPDGKYGHKYPVSGYNSTWAKASISGVINDECIVYQTGQVKLDYLIEFVNA